MTSVVIPAHNEAGVIDACLRSLLTGSAPGELEIVVACNGCTDDTAGRAAAHGPAVTVVSVPQASKVAALNAGDAACSGFPRLYLDADVLLDVAAVRRLVAALEPAGTALAASPAVRLDLGGASRAVRSYYRLWLALPSIRDDLVGRGVYAVSEGGHALVAPFPDVIADDHHVRSSVPRDRRVVVRECSSVVSTPRTLRALVRRRARVIAGNRQLDAGGPPMGAELLAALRREPRRLVDAPVFVLVAVAARVLRLRWLAGGGVRWGRDDSRAPSGP